MNTGHGKNESTAAPALLLQAVAKDWNCSVVQFVKFGRWRVVCTGHGAPDTLVDLADTATEVRKVKHAYDRGVRAQRGIGH